MKLVLMVEEAALESTILAFIQICYQLATGGLLLLTRLIQAWHIHLISPEVML